jgi:hypothetical protein
VRAPWRRARWVGLSVRGMVRVNGWAALKSDANIRRRDAPERRALVEAQVRRFVISGQLTTAAKIERVVANCGRMARVCHNADPFVYRIHPEHLQRLQIPK